MKLIVCGLQVFDLSPGLYKVVDIENSLSSFITVTNDNNILRTVVTLEPKSHY